MADGFVNVLKPPGMTSHDVVFHLRKVYGQKKVGHAGTLDPAAAGVLPVALGKATRLLEYMADVDKSYRCEMQLGVRTNTGDSTGQIIQEVEFTMPDEARVREVLSGFIGKITQRPSAFSAIKINGVRAYKLARQDKEVEMPTRQIMIYALELVAIYEDKILFDVHCSKGTYVRSLCEDIGARLGIPTTMSFLVRTHVGGFQLTDAATMEEISGYPQTNLRDIDYGLSLPRLELTTEQALAIAQGKRLKIDVSAELSMYNYQEGNNIAIYSEAKLVAIAQYRGRVLSPKKVLLGAE